MMVDRVMTSLAVSGLLPAFSHLQIAHTREAAQGSHGGAALCGSAM